MEPQICAVPEYLSCHFTRDAAWSPEAVAALQTCLWLPCCTQGGPSRPLHVVWGVPAYTDFLQA